MAISSLNSFVITPLPKRITSTTPKHHFTPKRTVFPSISASASVITTIPSPSSPYEILGVPETATCQEIKRAYRRLARTCHPDVAARSASGMEFMAVHSAYVTLSDRAKRAEYDWRKRPSTLTWVAMMDELRSPGKFSGRTCRNWETDQCW